MTFDWRLVIGVAHGGLSKMHAHWYGCHTIGQLHFVHKIEYQACTWSRRSPGHELSAPCDDKLQRHRFTKRDTSDSPFASCQDTIVEGAFVGLFKSTHEYVQSAKYS
jgi:hypothetical protein